MIIIDKRSFFLPDLFGLSPLNYYIEENCQIFGAGIDLLR